MTDNPLHLLLDAIEKLEEGASEYSCSELSPEPTMMDGIGFGDGSDI
jgi:hypothetical protein